MRLLASRCTCCERCPGRVTVEPRASRGAAMNSWIVWLIVAAVLGVAELLTTTLAFGLIAIAAVVAAVIGAFHLGLAFQLAAFVDRKSTRLNSSHPSTSYAVFCLK